LIKRCQNSQLATLTSPTSANVVAGVLLRFVKYGWHLLSVATLAGNLKLKPNLKVHCYQDALLHLASGLPISPRGSNNVALTLPGAQTPPGEFGNILSRLKECATLGESFDRALQVHL
jgi:hypothetical protein